MAKTLVIENLDKRQFVRSLYKNAHCRVIHGGFEIYYTDERKKSHRLGFDQNSRSKAWDAAAQPLYGRMLTKLEN